MSVVAKCMYCILVKESMYVMALCDTAVRAYINYHLLYYCRELKGYQ